MTSALASLKQRIEDAVPEETPDGLVCVIYDGKKGIRLVVDRESGRAIATLGESKQVNINPHSPEVACMRAMSGIVAGGIA